MTEQKLHQIGSEAPEAGCACGEHNDDVPALDATVIPHAIRHATIFGALDSLAPGFSMDLIAPHDPLPLLAQATQRYGEQLSWAYLTQGPETWTLRFTRS